MDKPITWEEFNALFDQYEDYEIEEVIASDGWDATYIIKLKNKKSQ